MEEKNQKPKTVLKEEGEVERVVFIDGSGARLDGTGSAIAWICPTTKERMVERIPGLTNNQAEYRAFLGALTALLDGTSATFFSDSELLCYQFRGDYRVRDPELTDLMKQIRSLINTKRLRISLQWVPRSRNSAGKLL